MNTSRYNLDMIKAIKESRIDDSKSEDKCRVAYQINYLGEESYYDFKSNIYLKEEDALTKSEKENYLIENYSEQIDKCAFCTRMYMKFNSLKKASEELENTLSKCKIAEIEMSVHEGKFVLSCGNNIRHLNNILWSEVSEIFIID